MLYSKISYFFKQQKEGLCSIVREIEMWGGGHDQKYRLISGFDISGDAGDGFARLRANRYKYSDAFRDRNAFLDRHPELYGYPRCRNRDGNFYRDCNTMCYC
jgi:hypothetical protein